MAPRDTSKNGQSHNNSHSGPYSSEEKQYMKDNWGSEYHMLRYHGLSIYKEEDREEGRSIVRAFREMDLEDEKGSNEDHRGERGYEEAIYDKERATEHYGREYDDVAHGGGTGRGATQYDEQGAEYSGKDDDQANPSTTEYEGDDYDEDQYDDSSDDEGSYNDGGSDGAEYDDPGYDDDDVDYDDDDDDEYDYDDYCDDE